MALEGDLSIFRLPDILQVVSQQQIARVHEAERQRVSLSALASC